MQFTKTDFIQYLNCPESLWLYKNKPAEYTKSEFSLFLKKLIKEGYEVESCVNQLFPNAVIIPQNASANETKQLLATTSRQFIQPSFETSKGIFARIDVLEVLEDGSLHIYEIKSSTSIKKDKKHNHIKDICFQKYVLSACGYHVSKLSFIYLNKEYIRKGPISPYEMLIIEEVTETVDEIYSAVVNEINAANTFVNKSAIDENKCKCKHNTRTNHCDSFSYFNKEVPPYSVYEIGNIRAKKIGMLVDNQQLHMLDIPADFKLNVKQQWQVNSLRQEKPMVDFDQIQKTLENLKFPLHFIDYETYASAIPKIDGLSPHKQLAFQVSIHTLDKGGEIKHFEYLADDMVLPSEMLSKMEEFTGLEGTFVSWHASFEVGRNKDMIQWLPNYKTYLTYMNEHMFDLETVFKKDYIDCKFHGSSSIKKVLPVICPDFTYDNLSVQNGTMALDIWGRMVSDPNFQEDKETTRKSLLEYCEMDTKAMVEIYKVLIKLTKN